MADEKKHKSKNEDEKCCSSNFSHTCKGGGVYGFGFVGALLYYITTATSFWMGVLGFFKAIVWPAILVFQLLKFFGL